MTRKHDIANTTESDGTPETAPESAGTPGPGRADWNPYVAGLALGLVLLATFLLMGFGLGSSSGATRLAYAGAHSIAPETTEANPYFSNYVGDGRKPLEDWMVFEVLGVLLGGVLGAFSARRMRRNHVIKGPTTSRKKRIAYAIIGGIIMGFGARLARGCTSGQALTGGAVLSLGSWMFMMAVFAGGYLMAPFTRRQWK